MTRSRRQSGDHDTRLGQRRGILDVARIDLNLTWARAEPESAALVENYPSPPMSGSPPPPPPLPPKRSQDAGDRTQGVFQASAPDVYRGLPPTHDNARIQGSASGTVRPFPAEASDRPAYSFPVPESPAARPYPFLQPQAPMLSQPAYLGPSSSMSAYAAGSRPAISEVHESTKAQRKPKGHVASACVPCKRAHLRCDAQRPCSRCLSTGKEEACVDVQHKKRGRPRLRDDRETARFEPSRFGSQAEPAAARRPLSLYGVGPSASVGTAFDESLRRSQSYRVLKSHPSESSVPRYLERASPADANIYPPPLSISTRDPEPAAYLTMDFEIAKASRTFSDAIGRPTSLRGAKLTDLLVASDREKALRYQQQMQDEQGQREQQYLPPIRDRQEEDRVMQGLGFQPEEIARFPLGRQDSLTFTGQDGASRTLAVRLGPSRQDSVAFIVMVLNLAPRPYQQPSPSPQSRDGHYAFPSAALHYGQPTPGSATFDPRQTRFGDAMYGSRQYPSQPTTLMPGLSPGVGSSYAASPSRPDYSQGPSLYQTPRSELSTAGQMPQPPAFQLPPIRTQQQHQQQHQQQQQQQQQQHHVQQQQQQQQQQRAGVEPATLQEQDSPIRGADRPRVDIGGLIDKGEQQEQSPHS